MFFFFIKVKEQKNETNADATPARRLKGASYVGEEEGDPLIKASQK